MGPRSILLLVLMPMLASCYMEQQQQALARCERQTQPAGFPSDMRGFNADLMDACMRAAGYRFDVSYRECKQRPGVPARVNAYCYAPATPIRAWLYQLERTVRGG